VQINLRTTAKYHVKMLEETGTKVTISTVKRVIYRHNLKGRSARKKPLLQNRHKKARLLFATAHGDKDCTLWRNVLWSDETMTIVMFGVKRGGLQAEELHPNREAWGWQHHVVGVLCCRSDWCTSQNRWNHEGGKLCGYIESTSQDISQEVEAWSQMGLGVAITKP
jgi:hypothetical protein